MEWPAHEEPEEEWPEGPLVLGVYWNFPEHLVRTASDLAAALGQHLVCAFVDPASYLTEWDPSGELLAHSLDPAINEEADFPSRELLQALTSVLGPPGEGWSFRLLNGDVPKALGRLAESTGASLIIVGGGRRGAAAWVDRLLAGSVSKSLIHRGQWPVLIVPDVD